MSDTKDSPPGDARPTLLVPGKLVGVTGAAAQAVPAEYIADLVRRRMAEYGAPPPKTPGDRVFIVRSETGSGKSTVLVARLFRLLRGEKSGGRLGGGGLLCTQPRVLTAQTLARGMAESPHYPDLVLGQTVGYQTGSINEKPRSGLIYATIGILLTQLRALTDAEVMNMYRIIVVDEAHERSLQADATLMALKAFLTRNMGNPRLPFIVLASATIPVEKYAAYFGVGPANVVEVRGRSFAVETRFPEVGTNDYVGAAAAAVLKIHRAGGADAPGRGDVLVFMPGSKEIKDLEALLYREREAFLLTTSAAPPFVVLTLTGDDVRNQTANYRALGSPIAARGLPALDAPGVFLRPSRRVILATVVAETGVTIETVKYVVDCGWHRGPETYFPGGFRGILNKPVPLSRARQRAGRAGRLFPGEYWPLFTRNVYGALEKDQLPEIFTDGVGEIFLDVVTSCLRRAPSRVEDDVSNVDGGGLLSNRVEDGLSNVEGGLSNRVGSLSGGIVEGVRVGGLSNIEDLSVGGGLNGGGLSVKDEFDAPAEGVFRVEDIDLLDAPPVPALVHALEQSVFAGFLRRARGGHALTPLGGIAARFSTYTTMAQRITISTACLWRVSVLDAIFVATMFDTWTSFVSPKKDLWPAAAFAAGLPEAVRRPESTAVRGTTGTPEKNAAAEAARARLGDSFIERLVVFGAFAGAVDEADGDLAKVVAWCGEHGVDAGAAFAAARSREEKIDDVIAAGLDPFWGGQFSLAAAATAAQFYARVGRLKQCVFAGLRQNLVAWDAGTRAHWAARARARVTVWAPGSTKSSPPPKTVVAGTIAVVGGRQPKMLYSLFASGVSVLDGYVDVDPQLEMPRGTY